MGDSCRVRDRWILEGLCEEEGGLAAFSLGRGGRRRLGVWFLSRGWGGGGCEKEVNVFSIEGV